MKWRVLAQATAIFLAFSAGASALSFNFTFTATSTAEDIAGFNAAANFWASQFTDNIMINMNVGTAALEPGVLAQAGSTRTNQTYTSFRDALTADATSAFDTQAVASLSAGTSFNMLLNRTSNNPNGVGSDIPYLDNDGDANNTSVTMTTANAKALGYVFSPGAIDADITFNSAFSWDYDRSDGITAGNFDFVGIAIHEIGHALGFISGVDILDGNSPPVNGPFSDNQFTFVSPMDLFRYSSDSAADGVIDWTASTTDKYFSLDNGATELAGFSTGKNFGDGQQASHWKDNLGIGILDPTAGSGELLVVSSLDLMAFDVIGWTPVPEPSSLLLGACGMLLAMRRRR